MKIRETEVEKEKEPHINNIKNEKWTTLLGTTRNYIRYKKKACYLNKQIHEKHRVPGYLCFKEKNLNSPITLNKLSKIKLKSR